MATRWRAMNGLVVALGLGGMAASIAPRDCPAQEVPGPPSLPAVHPLDRAVGATLKDGWPTVVVITSTASPESAAVIAVLAAGAPGQGAEPGGTDRVVGPGGECRADAPDGRDVGPHDPGLRQGSEGAGAGRRDCASRRTRSPPSRGSRPWVPSRPPRPMPIRPWSARVINTTPRPRPRRRRPRPSSIRRPRRLSRPLRLRRPPRPCWRRSRVPLRKCRWWSRPPRRRSSSSRKRRRSWSVRSPRPTSSSPMHRRRPRISR